MRIPFLSYFIKIKEYFSSGDMLVLWYRHYKVLIFAFFLLVLAFGGWVYYYSVFQYHFSDEEKRQYVDSYFKETTFKEARFHEVVDSIVARARIHENTIELRRNIFEDNGAKP